MVILLWGDVLVDVGIYVCMIFVDLELEEVVKI